MLRKLLVLMTLSPLALLVLPAVAGAQAVTPTDVERLQDAVFQAGTEVSQVRTRDAASASHLQAELDDLRDEVIYLKVKLRKEHTVARAEYADVRDRIEGLRSRTRTGPVASAAPARASAPVSPAPTAAPTAAIKPALPASARAGVEVPAGTETEVRVLDSLNSGTARVEDRFEAATVTDLFIDDRVVIPAGAIMRGVVTAVEPGTRTNRTARLTVSFDQVTVATHAYPIRATVTEAIKGAGIKGEAGRLGAGAVGGAILGGLLGGTKGAVAGVLIGGGGTMAATEGKDVQVPQGTVLRVRFDSPVLIGR